MMATVGVDEIGQAYNVNADTVAGAIAQAVDGREARVPHRRRRALRGLPRRRPRSSRGSTSPAGAPGWPTARSRRGMIPKLRSCIDALQDGVGAPTSSTGVPHALLLEFFTREGIGTMIVNELREEHGMTTSTRSRRSTRARDADVRAAARSRSCAAGGTALGQRGKRVPRLPRRARGHVARPRAPRRSPTPRRPGPHAAARLEPLLQRRAAAGRGAPRRAARRRRPRVLRQLRVPRPTSARSSSPGVTARPTAGPSATTCSRRPARSTAARSPRSPPPASRRSRRRSSRCRPASARSASATSTRWRRRWTSGVRGDARAHPGRGRRDAVAAGYLEAVQRCATSVRRC